MESSCWCSFPPKAPPTSTGITLIRLRGKAKKSRDQLPHLEDALIVGPHGYFAVASHVGHGCPELHEALVHCLRAEGIFEDDVCLAKTRLPVSASVLRGEKDVARGALFLGAVPDWRLG